MRRKIFGIPLPFFAFILLMSFFSPASHANDWLSYVNSAVSNPSISGVYWQVGTDAEGDLAVTAVAVDNNGNVTDVSHFDETGDLTTGATQSGEESLGDYIERTEGGGDVGSSGFYNPNDPFSDPYNCGFDCGDDDPFGTPDDPFGGGF